ncbi:MAG: acyl-CoA thioesterase domain-containing protein [Janthinobacterium lividum]
MTDRQLKVVSPSIDAPPADAAPLQSNGYAALIGPILQRDVRASSRDFYLRIEAHHLNSSGYIHGGLQMSFMACALEQLAIELLEDKVATPRVELLTSHFEFVGTAALGACLRAEVTVTRLTRSLVFLTGRLMHEDRPLLSAGATYKIGTSSAAHEQSAVSKSIEMPYPADAIAFDTIEPFGIHVERGYQRFEGDAANQQSIGVFRVGEHHLDPHNGGRLHDGVLLLMADQFVGRDAWRAVDDMPNVTLGFHASRMGHAALGDVVEVRSRVEGRTDAVVFLSGSFTVAGKTVMTVATSWKLLGKH